MLVPRSPAPLKRSALSAAALSPLSVMSDELVAEEAKRRKLNDGSTSADPYGNGIDGDDDDLLESSYNEDMADFYGACASQTDNPNTPLAGRHDDDDKPRLKQTKSIQDRVHGQIAMNGLLVAAMDTAEFQRLDRVRQLGGCYFVYPSATHTRKEHSMGVAHLAGFMAKHLAKSQPELEIDEADVLCVQLAGLVHDLGHGPFSHMFEDFMKAVTPAGEPKWEHEEMSGRLLRRLLSVNNVPVADYFAVDGRECSVAQAEEHINFVVKLIEGLKDEAPWPTDIGRPPSKRFLFDIVSNKRNGVDVDKLDYLVRDAMAAFGCSAKIPGFDIYRIIESSTVLHRRGACPGPEVCFQMKNALEILEVYSLRAKLHRQVYQHRIANVTEAMVTDILMKANDHFRVKGSEGSDPKGLRLSEAAHDEVAFVRLNDSILDALDLSTNDGLEDAHHILDRLKRREFYKQVGNQVNIETLPRCANPHCRMGTRIDALYCAQCGNSTAARTTGKWDPKSKAWASEGVVLTEAQILKQILSKCTAATRIAIEEADALFVKIVDIQIGKATTKVDQKGVLWSTYDPLVNVGFVNPKDLDEGPNPKPRKLKWEQFPQIYLPAAGHTRTMWCYLRTEKPGWRTAIEAAIDAWKEDLQLTEQVGTSNMASPAQRLGSNGKRRGGLPTPRGLNSDGKLPPANIFKEAFSGSAPPPPGGRRLSAISEASADSADPTAKR